MSSWFSFKKKKKHTHKKPKTNKKRHDIYQHVIPMKWYSEIPEKQRNNVKVSERCDYCSVLPAIFYTAAMCVVLPGLYYILVLSLCYEY